MVSNFREVQAAARVGSLNDRNTPGKDQGADILIISHDPFIPALAPLVVMRENQGYAVHVSAISEIYQPDDDTDDEKIAALRDFLINIMDPVSGWNPRPSFVLLVGDKDEITPAYFTGTYSDLGWTDYPFACVIGDDWYGDLAIGRFSASQLSDVVNQVDKTLFYEQHPRALTGVAGASDFMGFEPQADAKIEHLMEPGGLSCQTNYNGRDGSDHSTFVHVFNGTLDSVTGKDFWPGTDVITVDTHGSEFEWGGLLGDWQVNDTTLTNNIYLPIAFVSACDCGRFETEDCIQERLQVIQAGTVANTGSSTMSSGGTNNQLLNVAIQAIMGVDPPFLPDEWDWLISPDIDCAPILGQAMAIAKNEFLAYYGDPDGWNVKECMMQFNLFGDPALRTSFCVEDSIFTDGFESGDTSAWSTTVP